MTRLLLFFLLLLRLPRHTTIYLLKCICVYITAYLKQLKQEEAVPQPVV